jgi:hypothetical protein
MTCGITLEGAGHAENPGSDGASPPGPGLPRLARPCDAFNWCPGLAIPFIRVILHTIGFLARRTRSSIG